MPLTTITMRGRGPAPNGYARCWSSLCPARRDPSTGRFSEVGNHYHPERQADDDRASFIRDDDIHVELGYRPRRFLR